MVDQKIAETHIDGTHTQDIASIADEPERSHCSQNKCETVPVPCLRPLP